MTFAHKMQQALHKDINSKKGEDIHEWDSSEQGSALAAVAEEYGFSINAWGIVIGEQAIAQAMVDLPVGRAVFDLEGDVFFEVAHKSMTIESETERTLLEDDPQYALERAYPEEHADFEKVLERMSMEIVPNISGSGNYANLNYARNDMRNV